MPVAWVSPLTLTLSLKGKGTNTLKREGTDALLVIM